MTVVSTRERLAEVKRLLVHANGDGMTVSDLARRMALSKARIIDLLEILIEDGYIVKCKVEGSQWRYGMNLYFDIRQFEKMTDLPVSPRTTYRLFQRSIFELIGEMDDSAYKEIRDINENLGYDILGDM